MSLKRGSENKTKKIKITHVKLVNELLDPGTVAGEVFRRCGHFLPLIGFMMVKN